jgi:hypothetical protein
MIERQRAPKVGDRGVGFTGVVRRETARELHNGRQRVHFARATSRYRAARLRSVSQFAARPRAASNVESRYREPKQASAAR